jgi:multicomponent Na+:H+ antiporter subunit D
VLRAACHIFLGWGERPEPIRDPANEPTLEREFLVRRRRTPAVMFVPAVALLGCALVIAVGSDLVGPIRSAADGFTDRVGYADLVLDGRANEVSTAPVPLQPDPVPDVVSTFGAMSVAGLALFGGRLRGAVSVGRWSALTGPVSALRAAHSGHVGDYVAWLTLGAFVLGFGLSLGIH